MRRAYDLLEAPINDYALIGNWGDNEKSNSFSYPKDRHLIQSPNLIKKVRKKFDNTDFVFNLYFVNLPGARKHSETGMWEPQRFERDMPDAWKLIQQYDATRQVDSDPTEDINIVYVGNAGANKVPMTAWIMAHRIGHVMKNTRNWNDFEEDFISSIIPLLKEVYNLKIKRADFYSNKILAKFFEAIGTMSSARHNNLGGRPYEFLYEMLAQYLTTGKLSFNDLPKYFGNRNIRYYAHDEETREYYSFSDGAYYSVVIIRRF